MKNQNPKKPCRKCKIKLTRETYCKKCKITPKDKKKKYVKDPKVKRWLNSSKYKKARLEFIYKNPFCNSVGCNKLTEILDHIKAHCGNERLFWDENNWQPKCKSCHDRKTATHDGGFGNPIK